MKAMIFAAGLGTRLKPYTDTMPKALVPVGGKPMLWHQVQKLKAAGVDSLVINVHHFADQIIDYVQSHNGFGMQVQISDERDCLLDTGGGLLHARKFLEEGSEPFLIHNVDIFSNLDLKAFIDYGLPAGGDGRQALAKLLVSDRDSSRKLLFNSDMELCGWKNLRTGELKGPVTDASGMRELAFGGVHLVSPAVFKAFDALSAENETAFSGSFSIIDFYLAACRRNKISACVQQGLKLVDAGKSDTLEKCLLID